MSLLPDITTEINDLRKRLTSLESGNQNKNIKIPTGGKITLNSETADPTIENGKIYYNSNTKKFRVCKDGVWNDMVAGALTKSDVGLGNVDNTSDATKNASPTFTGNPTHTIVHGNNYKLNIPAGNNGGGTGSTSLYFWISEPSQTWTGAGIARNMVNLAGWPRVNTGLGGQMINFNENNDIVLVTETAAGVRRYPIATSGDGVYIAGNCSALSFTDRTPFFEGDALAEIKKIKGDGKGGIDHTSLPVFAQKEIKSTPHQKDKMKKGEAPLQSVVEPGRDLGAMISILTVAVQQLTDRIEKIEKIKKIAD